jgi:tetratricopeptide (TPR) repeat protein
LVYSLDAMRVPIAVLSLIVILLVASAGAAIDPWEYRTNAAEFAFANGDYERAEAEFRGALELAQKLPPGDRKLEISLESLARFYEHQGRVDEAQPLYLLLIAAREFRVGGDDPSLLDTLVAVARVSVPAGDTPAAEASLERYLAIAEASGEADPGQHWGVLSMFARMKTLSEEHERALELQRRAVEVVLDDPGATGVERAVELESLAQLELLHGSAEHAEELLVQAVELRASDGEGASVEALAKAAATALGAAEPEMAERIGELALAAARSEGGDELPALKVLADASWLKVRRSGELVDLIGSGGDDPALVTAAQRMSSLVELQRATLQPGHPDRVETLARLVRIEALRRHTTAAADRQRRYLEEISPSTAANSPTQLRAREELVVLLAASGDTSAAVAENSQLIGRLESSYGETDARLIPPLQRQLELLIDAGRKKEAKAIRKRLKKLSR